MKIALVTDWYEPRLGGIELHLQDLASRLIALGHDVHIITSTPGREHVDGVRVHRIDAPRAPKFGFLITPGGVRAIGDVLAREKFDIAHCHVSIVSPAALGGAAQAQKLRTPTVITFHSVVPANKLFAHGVNAVVRSSRWNVVWTAVSDRVAREMTPLSGGKPISILRNGVDLDFWRSVAAADQTNKRGARIELISVMRFNPKKRPMALLHLMERLKQEGVPARLRVVGDGPLKKRMESKIEARALASCVELCGRLNREQIRELYRSCDLFVLPTVRESFGLAAIEARAAGIPVAAMAASGVSEFIEHDRDGVLASNDAEMVRQVSTVSCDRARLEGLRRAKSSRIEAVEWKTVLAAHIATYDRVRSV